MPETSIVFHSQTGSETFLGQFQPFFQGAPGDGVTDRPPDGGAFELSFDQEILRAGFDGGDREIGIVIARQHNDRQRGRCLAHAGDGVETVTVRQRQIEQHHIAGIHGNPVAGRLQRRYGMNLEPAAFFAQDLAHEPRVTGIVFYQKYANGLRVVHRSKLIARGAGRRAGTGRANAGAAARRSTRSP
jgi:hypothetical protein